MKNKQTFIAIIIALSLIVVAVFMVNNKSLENPENDVYQNGKNVSIVDGKQIIYINAKGGYMPQVTDAKAGIETVIKMNTKATFDCSSALVIPSLGYRQNLTPKGETLIDVPPQKAGTKMEGLCSMGMYNFSINFN